MVTNLTIFENMLYSSKQELWLLCQRKCAELIKSRQQLLSKLRKRKSRKRGIRKKLRAIANALRQSRYFFDYNGTIAPDGRAEMTSEEREMFIKGIRAMFARLFARHPNAKIKVISYQEKSKVVEMKKEIEAYMTGTLGLRPHQFEIFFVTNRNQRGTDKRKLLLDLANPSDVLEFHDDQFGVVAQMVYAQLLAYKSWCKNKKAKPIVKPISVVWHVTPTVLEKLSQMKGKWADLFKKNANPSDEDLLRTCLTDKKCTSIVTEEIIRQIVGDKDPIVSVQVSRNVEGIYV